MLDRIKMRMRINTLENENEMLKNTMKDKLYEAFMNKLTEPIENQRLKKENRRLRRVIKNLKEEK